MNFIYWIILLLVNFSLITIAYKLFGKFGLFAWIAMAGVIANIQVIKTIELFGLVTTLGNIVYATTFLVTDILSENYGKKAAIKAVYVSFFILVSATILMQIGLAFTPHQSDFSQQALSTIFGFFPRVVVASLAAYLVSQTHDVWAYHFWKKKFPKFSQIIIRNNLSTMISQLLDTLIFCFIAFWGVYEFNVFMDILITTYILKWIVAVLDTPFVYLAAYLKKKKKVLEG
ncbi:MAG: queuosine precursor transporter [Halanaerobiales bacterium]